MLFGCGGTPKRDDYSVYVNNSGILVDQFDAPLFVKLDSEQSLDFRAIYESNNTVDANSILYQGGAGVGGLLAQVLVHNAINQSAQTSKLASMQEAANNALQPLSMILEQLKTNALIHEHGEYFFNESEAEYVLDSKPIFFFSKDLRSLSVKHIVNLYKSGERKPVYQNMVEVLETNVEGDPVEYWLNADDQVIKNTTNKLYKTSLAIAVADIKGKFAEADSKQKNYRIQHGERKRFERGTHLHSFCNTSIIRNLRGWLIAFNQQNDDALCSVSDDSFTL